MKQLLTRSSMYGIHILTFMATVDSNRPIRLNEISEALQVSPDSLAKVIRNLSRAGLLRVDRGRDGGCRLRRSPAQITALEAVEAVDGEFELGDPVLNGAKSQETGLRIVKALGDALKGMKESLSNTTIAALAGEGPQSKDQSTDQDEGLIVSKANVSRTNLIE